MSRDAEIRVGIELAILDAVHWTHSVADTSAFDRLMEGGELLRRAGEITEDEEERWLRSLIEAGWHLLPAADEPTLQPIRDLIANRKPSSTQPPSDPSNTTEQP